MGLKDETGSPVTGLTTELDRTPIEDVTTGSYLNRLAERAHANSVNKGFYEPHDEDTQLMGSRITSDWLAS